MFFWKLYTIFLQIPSNNFFSKREFPFQKGNFFSQTARCSPTPMSLGSSASFRRIVPSRDTSTTESEIPSFRDAKPHGLPLFPSPYPPPRFVVGSFGLVGWNWMLLHSEKGELFSNGAFSFARGNSVICYQFQLITPNSQLPTPNSQLLTGP